MGVVEVAEKNPGDTKFNGDRCKVLIENKAIIDRYLLDGCFVDSIGSLQICGLGIFLINVTLQDQGLYVGTQFYHSVVNNSLDTTILSGDLYRRRAHKRSHFNKGDATRMSLIVFGDGLKGKAHVRFRKRRVGVLEII